MKIGLTENGVVALYNQASQSAKVQVLYMTQWNMIWYLRVTDSKNLSPIMLLLKLKDAFRVGDVIFIKKGHIIAATNLKDEEYKPLIDLDFCHYAIQEYQVMESRNNMGVLYQHPNSIPPENAYWHSLSITLAKGDTAAEALFKEGERRLQFLRPDCKLLRERGNELYKRQEYSQALTHYDMAKQKDHFDARVWNNSSQTYFCNNEYKKAERDAFVALKLDPFNKKAYYRAAQAMEAVGEQNKALELLESGIFMSGQSEDLVNLHQVIKGKKDNAVSNNNKRKNHNGEVDVKSVLNGLVKKTVKPKESPQRKLKDQQDGKSNLKGKAEVKNESANSHNGAVLSCLAGARMLYETGKFKNALELYEGVVVPMKTLRDHLSKSEVVVLKYLVTVSKFLSNFENVVDTVASFNYFLTEEKFIFPPAIHYWLARVYHIVDDQDRTIHHANTMIQLMESTTAKLCWPTTKDPILETSHENLKKWFHEGEWRPAPFAKCRYESCIDTQGHSTAKREIYISDHDFRGYVEISCEDICLIVYHPCCWKAAKEQDEGISGKKLDKDFLGSQCLTPDCAGKIYSILIYDEHNNLKNEITKDKKDKKGNNAKQKKKKDKKKDKGSGSKNDDKKNKKLSDDNKEDKIEIKTYDIMENCTEEVRGKKKKNQSLSLEPIDFEHSNIKVLKPKNSVQSDIDQQLSKSKSKSKKKKKGKQLINILDDEMPDGFSQNEYLSRLRSLRQQMDLDEGDACSSFKINTKRRCLVQLDSEKPFYLPQHLRDNLVDLESILQSKIVLSSSSELTPESTQALLEFMYDWLKGNKPMSISDTRLKDCISDNFPPSAVSYVTKNIGIKNFLLQSFRFALIDDIICVSEHVVEAESIALSLIMDRIKSAKYLISDGFQAQKFIHLIDDAKSTCSSTSSQSVSNSNIARSISQIVTKSQGMAATSVISYKNAALGKSNSSTSCLLDSNSTGKTTDSQNNFIKLQPRTKVVKEVKKTEVTPRKNIFKTMDIDAFEVGGGWGQLFSPIKGNETNDSSSVDDTNGLDDDFDFDLPPRMQKLKETLREQKERIELLEKSSAQREQEFRRLEEEKRLLAIQNEELNDRFSQIKTRTNVEISSLKKEIEEGRETSKAAESNLDWLKSQRDGELRKATTERSKFQDEIKSLTIKTQSLQLTIDTLNSGKDDTEEELQQKSIQLTHQQEQILGQQDTINNIASRAKEAEYKYLSMKKDLINLYLEKIKKRLSIEVNRMRELLPIATIESRPSKITLASNINEWDEAINLVENTIRAITENGQRYMDYINSGRPLNALPPGDLQIPTIPDLTIAPLLFIASTSSDKFSLQGSSLSNITQSPIGFSNTNNNQNGSVVNNAFSNNFFTSVNPFSLSSLNVKLGGLASGHPVSLGQLGVGANTPLGEIGSEIKISDNPKSSDSFGFKTSDSIGFKTADPIGLPKTIDCFNTALPMKSQSSNFPASISDNSEIKANPITSSLSSSIAASNLTSTLPPSFSMTPKQLHQQQQQQQQQAGDKNTIFVGQLPWNFKEEDLHTIFAKFGEITSAAIHDKGAAFEGKHVPRCAFVTFRTSTGKDFALRSAEKRPITFGGHPLNIQSKEIKKAISAKQLPSAMPELNPAPLMQSLTSKPSLSGLPPSLAPSQTIVGSGTPSLQKANTAMKSTSSFVKPVPITRFLGGENVDAKPFIPANPVVTPSQPNFGATAPAPVSFRNATPVSFGTSAANTTSAFGLQGLIDANRASERNVKTPPTPTPKPKFQNLRTSSQIGAIGTLPPKLVRPIPRSGSATNVPSLPTAPVKDDGPVNSAAYKRLIDECKARYGANYSVIDIHKAIMTVRGENKNSLSGLSLSTIIEQVSLHLKGVKTLKTSVAPWAQLTQTNNDWQGSIGPNVGAKKEDQCAICLEPLKSYPTTPLPCHHLFHESCINNWLSKKSDCPICRKFALNCDEYPSLTQT